MASLSSDAQSVLLTLSNNLADAVAQAGAVHRRRPRAAAALRQWRPLAAGCDRRDRSHDRARRRHHRHPAGRHDSQATLAGRDPEHRPRRPQIEAQSAPAATIGDCGGASRRAYGAGGRAIRARAGSARASASISALGGPWNTWRGGQVEQFIRADVTLYPGFSGGPLVDAAGRIVGINTSGLSRNMGLTIPAATVNRVVEQLLTKGRIAARLPRHRLATRPSARYAQAGARCDE